MNRLTKEKYPKFLVWQAINIRQELDKENKVWYIGSIEPGMYFLENHTQTLSFCDATNYENYKEWIVYWKNLYKHISEQIRIVKKHAKTFQKESNLINRCYLESKVTTVRAYPDTALKFLKNFANHLLRVRQQMKIWNKYYMISRKDCNNV